VKGDLPEDLCLLNSYEMPNMALLWDFRSERDIAKLRPKWFTLRFDLASRSFSGYATHGSLNRVLMPSDVAIMQGLLPRADLARAIAMSILQTAT